MCVRDVEYIDSQYPDVDALHTMVLSPPQGGSLRSDIVGASPPEYLPLDDAVAMPALDLVLYTINHFLIQSPPSSDLHILDVSHVIDNLMREMFES